MCALVALKCPTSRLMLSGDVVEEESWNAVNEGSLEAVRRIKEWELYDIRALSRQVD